ncbi:MAG: T9SS type A sorting domain-containing protein [Bacteroidales bacterium]|nr:T9SS type A sorting domain-containing protein [Bacteroidales bacterium]
MKKLFYSIVVVMILWLLAFGQGNVKRFSSMPLKTMNVPCLDSSYYWIGANFSLLFQKMIVSARVPNASPFLEAERKYLQYDTINNQWHYYSKTNFTYFGTHSGAPEESRLERPWSLAINAWDDTLYYIKYTGKYNYQIPYPIQIITKQIQGNYNYPTSQFTYKTKDVYTLINDSCPSQHISYNYNLSTQVYDPTQKRIFSYDANNNLTSITYQFYDINTSQFTNSFKELYSFNGNLLQQSISQFWDGTNWVNTNKTINIYDSNNRIIKRFYLNWNTNVWDSSFKQLFYYNPAVDSSIAYSWNVGTNTWDPNYKHANFYNSQGQTLFFIYYGWNGTSWYEVNKVTYSYDAQGNLIQMLTQVWDGTQLVNNYKTNNYYTGSNLDSTISFYWDNVLTTWIPTYKGLYSYGTLNEIIIEKYYDYDNVNNQWVENSKYQHFYHMVDISTIPALIKDESFFIYPNPTSNFLIISFKEELSIDRFIIRDAKGKVILSQEYNSRQLDIQQLSSGLYYLSIITKDKQILTKPFIKQ